MRERQGKGRETGGGKEGGKGLEGGGVGEAKCQWLGLVLRSCVGYFQLVFIVDSSPWCCWPLQVDSPASAYHFPGRVGEAHYLFHELPLSDVWTCSGAVLSIASIGLCVTDQ